MKCIFFYSQVHLDILCRAIVREKILFLGTEEKLHYYNPEKKCFGIHPFDKKDEVTEISLIDFLMNVGSYEKLYHSFYIKIRNEDEFKNVLKRVNVLNPFATLLAKREGFNSNKLLYLYMEMDEEKEILLTLKWQESVIDDMLFIFDFEQFIDVSNNMMLKSYIYKIKTENSLMDLKNTVDEFAKKQGLKVFFEGVGDEFTEMNYYLIVAYHKISFVFLSKQEDPGKIQFYENQSKYLIVSNFIKNPKDYLLV